MKAKNLKVLFILVIILLAYIFFFDNPYRKEQKIKEQANESLFKQFNTNDINKIIINTSSEDTSFIFDRENDGKWYLSKYEEKQNNKEEDNKDKLKKYRVDNNQIDTIFKKIKELKKEELASRNESKHSVYGVTDNEGINVILKADNKEVISFILGKNGPFYPSQYLRKDKQKEVYLIKEDLKPYFVKRKNNWRDKQILGIPRDHIKSITWFKYKQKSLSINRTDKGFVINYPKQSKVRKNSLELLLGKLENFQAFDFASEDNSLSKLGLANVRDSLEIVLNDGEHIKIFIGKKEKNLVYLKTSREDYVYKIREEELPILLKKFDEIREKQNK